jgi:uncharacterized membrane protein
MQRREKCFRSVTFVLFILFSLWGILQLFAPFLLPTNSVSDLSGSVAVLDNDHVISQMDFPWSFLYTMGDRLCHQRVDRSFTVNGNQMPFCSRCTALWLGIAVGLGFMVLFSFELTHRFFFVFVLGIVPLGIDGIGQLAGFWESTNILRLGTGLLAGFVCGIALGVIEDELRSTSRSKNFLRR